MHHLDAYLSATQLGVTVASLGLGWLGASAFTKIFHLAMNKTAAAVVAFVFVTFLTIIFGELVPKNLAIRKVEGCTRIIALPLRGFYLATRPLTWLMYIAAAAILRIFRITPASDRELAHSEEELRMILEASQEVGHIDEVEQTLMRRALTFGDQTVSDIMVPRTELAALPTAYTVGQAIDEVAETNHTRYPAYEDDVDNIVGYIHVKDLYRASRSSTLRRLLRPVGFIAETSNVEVALQRFQSTRTPLRHRGRRAWRHRRHRDDPGRGRRVDRRDARRVRLRRPAHRAAGRGRLLGRRRRARRRARRSARTRRARGGLSRPSAAGCSSNCNAGLGSETRLDLATIKHACSKSTACASAGCSSLT